MKKIALIIALILLPVLACSQGNPVILPPFQHLSNLPVYTTPGVDDYLIGINWNSGVPIDSIIPYSDVRGCVPVGGPYGYILTKASGANCDTAWTPPDTNVPINYARSHASTNQVVTGGVYTKIMLDTVDYDSSGSIDTTNYRIVPKSVGYYLVTGQVLGSISAGSAVNMNVGISKNGVASGIGASGSASYDATVTSNILAATVTDVIYFNGLTDYVELYCQTTNNITLAVVSNVNNYLTVIGPLNNGTGSGNGFGGGFGTSMDSTYGLLDDRSNTTTPSVYTWTNGPTDDKNNKLKYVAPLYGTGQDMTIEYAGIMTDLNHQYAEITFQSDPTYFDHIGVTVESWYDPGVAGVAGFYAAIIQGSSTNLFSIEKRNISGAAFLEGSTSITIDPTKVYRMTISCDNQGLTNLVQSYLYYWNTGTSSWTQAAYITWTDNATVGGPILLNDRSYFYLIRGTLANGQISYFDNYIVKWGTAASDASTLTNLSGYALLNGRSGGQTLSGGTGAGEGLTLGSTSNATKGHIFFGQNQNYFDETRSSLNDDYLFLNYNVSGALPLGAANIRLYNNAGNLTPTTATWGLLINDRITDQGATNNHTPIGAYIGYEDAAPGTLTAASGIYGGDIQVYKGTNVPDGPMLGLTIGLYKNPALGLADNIGLDIYSREIGDVPFIFNTTTGTRNGNAIQIDGTAGWTNGIKYLDTDNATVLFQVDQDGKVLAGGGSANHAICWKADGKTLGYCSQVVDASGLCGVCN